MRQVLAPVDFETTSAMDCTLVGEPLNSGLWLARGVRGGQRG